ncbi:MAG: IS4 family transposase, partial [Oscillospiraceae bacterium]|nr:IS4 family transposase [Oscillospiraceae bacterium]
MLKAQSFIDKHKKHKTDFTRNRKLGFFGVMTSILSILVKNLQLCVEEFRELFMTGIGSYSKQAFSAARGRIDPSAFKELFEMVVHELFAQDGIKRIKGYRLFAIDGTDMMLAQSAEIREKFTSVSGSRLPHARASFFYDVVSGFVLDACFDSVKVDERTMAKHHIETVRANLNENDIILCDRGYPSKEFFALLADLGLHFVMRLQKSFSAEIDNASENDFEWHLDYKDKNYTFRVVKLTRPDETESVLVTNLSQEALNVADLEEIYRLRWSIETRFAMLKVRLEAERFSGKTVESLLQDFYARLYLMNIEAAVKLETDAIIAERDAAKPHKYPRKTNEAVLFGLLRSKIAQMLLNPSRQAAILADIIQRASKSTIDIHPGRSSPRSHRSHKRTTQ